MSISIKLDTRESEQLLNSAASQIPRAMRSVVSKVARDARRTALNVAARDGNESVARATAGMQTVRAASAMNLSATWTVPGVKVQATDSLSVGPSIRKGPIALAVELLSGGGSTNVLLPRGFVIKGQNSGKALLFDRKGPGPWGSLVGTKQIFGELTRTGMGQPDSAARLAWEKDANAQMKLRTTEAVAAALAGSRSVPSEGSD